RLVGGRRVGVERLERAGPLDPAALQLVEQLVEALDQRGDLDLLEGDRGHPRAVAGLEEEGAIAGFADGAGDESVWCVEQVAASSHPDRERTGCGSQAPSARPPGTDGAGGWQATDQPTWTAIWW